MDGISKAQIEKFIDEALHEDVRDGDHTSLACIQLTVAQERGCWSRILVILQVSSWQK